MSLPRRRIALAAFTLATVVLTTGAAAAPPPPAPYNPPPTGTLMVCSASGTRPVSGAFLYTLAAPGSAGGSQTQSVSVGTCSVQIFYPQGVQVIVTETVPVGDAVESISIAGGGSTIASSNLAAGEVAVTVGSGQSAITFKTSGPIQSGPSRDCVVPNVIGLALTTAAASLRHNSCKLGVVRRVYSRTVRAGRVISQSPRRGTVLAPNAPVDVTVSRGPRP